MHSSGPRRRVPDDPPLEVKPPRKRDSVHLYCTDEPGTGYVGSYYPRPAVAVWCLAVQGGSPICGRYTLAGAVAWAQTVAAQKGLPLTVTPEVDRQCRAAGIQHGGSVVV